MKSQEPQEKKFREISEEELKKVTGGSIPPMPRGVPQIEVTYDIDSTGIFKVAENNPEHYEIISKQ